MALQSSGAISANNINVELGKTGTTQFSWGSTNARNLSDVSSGAISLASFYGKALWQYLTGSAFPTMTSTSAPAPYTCSCGGGSNGGAVVFDGSLTWQTNVVTSGNLNVDKPYGYIYMNGALFGSIIPVYTNFNAGSPCQNIIVRGRNKVTQAWDYLCQARGGSGANENAWTGNVATAQIECDAFLWRYEGGGCDGRLGEADITAWYQKRFAVV